VFFFFFSFKIRLLMVIIPEVLLVQGQPLIKYKEGEQPGYAIILHDTRGGQKTDSLNVP